MTQHTVMMSFDIRTCPVGVSSQIEQNLSSLPKHTYICIFENMEMGVLWSDIKQ